MTEAQTVPVAGSGPHSIRITDNGKIQHWVSFALNFLEARYLDSIPSLFHTLPATPKAPTETARKPDGTTPKLSKATTAVPRLLSVVEIVKREFIKSLEAKRSPRLAGLHQYNEIGCLESLETTVEEDRAVEIQRALSGKNHVKLKMTPFMKITLSLNALPELAERGATYQPPTIRKLSKSAKMRMKKRERAAKNGTLANEMNESTPEAVMEG